MKNLTRIGLILIITASLSVQNSLAQTPFQASTPVDQVSIGIGAGLDYGGIGGNLNYYPTKSIGLFGGLGYAIAGVGFNGGLKFRYIPKKPEARVRPYGLAMYGYNAGIAVLNASQHNKLFYGPSFGAGMDIHRSPQKRGYWSISIFVPVRKPEVNDYIDSLINNFGVSYQNTLFPVAVSIGYKIIIL